MIEIAQAAIFETAPTAQELLSRGLNFLLSIFAILAIISAVAVGILYMRSDGDEENLETAKKATLYVLIGTLVGIGALVIVQQMAEFFG